MICCAITVLILILLSPLIALAMLASALMGGGPSLDGGAGISGGGTDNPPRRIGVDVQIPAPTINWRQAITDEGDGRETARSQYGIEIKPVSRHVVSVSEFDSLGVGNHRAQVGKTLDDIFPPEDRPRGDADTSAVTHFMTARAEVNPVMVLSRDGQLTVLDGVHRLVAAYLLGSPIAYWIYEAA